MRNINFNIDFKIDREKFECALQKDNKFHAFLEDSLHAGVNIKVPYEKDLNKIKLKCIEFPKYERWPDSRTYITYGEYLSTLSLKEQKKKLKQSYNTILVFQSGKVILSATLKSCGEDTYNKFITFLITFKEQITENLEIGDSKITLDDFLN